MTPLAQALRRAAPLRPVSRAPDARATDARATDLLANDQQVPVAPAPEYAPSTDHNPPATRVPATTVPVGPALVSQAPGSQPSAEQPLRSEEPSRLSPVGGNSQVAAAAAPCGLAAQHLADWQRATQARRVLVLATRPDPPLPAGARLARPPARHPHSRPGTAAAAGDRCERHGHFRHRPGRRAALHHRTHRAHPCLRWARPRCHAARWHRLLTHRTGPLARLGRGRWPAGNPPRPVGIRTPRLGVSAPGRRHSPRGRR